MNSLVILEVLSHQLQNWKSQLTIPHPEVQESSTQTDTTDSSPSGVRRLLPKYGGSQWALFLRIYIDKLPEGKGDSLTTDSSLEYVVKVVDLENPLKL